MKKIVSILLVFVLVLSLISCAKTETAEDSISETETAEVDSSDVKYPASGTLTLICPVKVGGNMDVMMRLVAKHLPKYLEDKDVIVENIVGGASIVAATEYLTDDVNSDRMIFLDVAQHVVTPALQNALYDYTAFTPVYGIGYTEPAIWVAKDSDFQTWEDVLDYSKTNTLILGTGPIGGPPYVGQVCALTLAGAENFEVVVGKSNPENIANLMGGHVDITLNAFLSSEDYYINGDIRPIISLGNEAFEGYEGYPMNVETLRSKNVDFSWFAHLYFAMRSDTDEDIINKMKDALEKTYKDPEFVEDWISAGFEYFDDTPSITKRAMEDMTTYLSTIMEILGN